jgi:hypothetical protein
VAAVILFPKFEVTPTQERAVRDVAMQTVQDLVPDGREQGTAIKALGPRDVLGGSRARWYNPVGLRADVWSGDLFPGAAVPEWRAVVIYGYVALAPHPQIDALRLSSAAATVGEIELAPLYAYPPGERDAEGLPRFRIGYFNPVYFPPTAHVGLNLLAGRDVKAGRERFFLLGVVAFPNGVGGVVNQPQPWRPR